MSLQPGEYSERKWSDPPQFELVDQHIGIAPGDRVEVVDQQFGAGPALPGKVVALEPATDRAAERLIVDLPGGRLALTHRYGWAGDQPGVSVEFRAGRNEVTATDLATGESRRIQIVVPEGDR